MFHVLEKELAWRKSTGRTEGFEAMKASKPIVAVGAEHPLLEEQLMADYFRELPTPSLKAMCLVHVAGAARC